MSEIVVYSARPERVIRAVSLLQQHNIAFRVINASHTGYPWVSPLVPSQALVVPGQLAAQARMLLAPLEEVEAASAGRTAHQVRWRLVGAAVSAAGIILFQLGFGPGTGAATAGTLLSLATLIACLISLRRSRSRSVGTEAS